MSEFVPGNSREERRERLTVEQKAAWLIAQTDLIRSAEESARSAEAEVVRTREELARFIARHTTPEIWQQISAEQADEIIVCMPDGEGAFGLSADEGLELSEIWLERSGVNPGDLG